MREKPVSEPGRLESMRKKIQKSMFMVIGITLLIAYTITILFVYVRIRSLAQDSIRRVAEYTAAAVNISGESYLRQLDNVEKGTRITLIDAKGNVCYDTEQDEFTFENHLERPEVQTALKNGMGQDVRHSDTIGQDMFYCAIRLNDGNILRVSMTVRSISNTALTLLPVMTVIGLVMLAFAYGMARRQAAALVRPINRLDLDKPLENDIYEEMTPLLQRIEDSNKAKEAVAQMRKEFSANVSHELKTPLTSISGYAEIMRDGLVKPEDVPKFSERIYKEAQRMLTLINDIIQLSRLDEGRLEQKEERVDLFELSHDIVSRLAPKAADCGVHVELTGESCTVIGVRRLLDEMIYNLTENAIKYNHAGGRVDLWVGRQMDTPEVIVTDTGIGIAKDQQERIFERFYRVDKSRSKETGGTGLGLSIVKHGAELSHAKVKVTSELGKGTRMELIFHEPGEQNPS